MGEIAVAPLAANDTDKDIVETLTVSVAGGNSKTVTLTHKTANTGGGSEGLTIKVDMKESITKFPTTQNKTEVMTRTIDGYEWSVFNIKQQTTSDYIMVYGAGVSAIATRGYVQTPAVAGRTLKMIKVTTPSSGTISAKAALKIVDVDGAQIAPSKNTSTTKTTYEFTLGVRRPVRLIGSSPIPTRTHRSLRSN